eukprot:TRINITY_DN5673_c0_g1_i1.p1 TRINITY_DN5673_c0_g1~~TRINITY_DN5673_c0_g1_i1.p1  ORF type:complete len:141 (+),score=24.43 TRINITY_DN5673_c0_g1_i1:409-831(+)
MLMERNEECQRRIDELESERTQFLKDIDDLKNEREKLREENDRALEQVDDSSYENKRLKMRLRDVEGSFTQSIEQISELKRELQHLTNSHLTETEALESQIRVLEDKSTRSKRRQAFKMINHLLVLLVVMHHSSRTKTSA